MDSSPTTGVPSQDAHSSPKATQQQRPSQDMGEAHSGHGSATPRPVRTSARDSQLSLTNIPSLSISGSVTSGREGSLSRSAISGTIIGETSISNQSSQIRLSPGSSGMLRAIDRQTDSITRNNVANSNKRDRESEPQAPPAKRNNANRPKYCKLFLDVANLPNMSFNSLITLLEANIFFKKAISCYPTADHRGCVITFLDQVTASKFNEAGYQNNLSNCEIRPTRHKKKYTDFLLHNIPIEISTMEIQEALTKEIGDEVQNVHRLTARASNNHVFLTRSVRVTVPVGTAHCFQDTHINLFGINKYKVTEPNNNNKNQSPQCTRCWAIGHTSRQCQAPNVSCKTCAGRHDYRECTITEPHMFKCISCGQGHKATFSGCSILKAAREKQKKRTRHISAVSSHRWAHFLSQDQNQPDDIDYEPLILSTQSDGRHELLPRPVLHRQPAINSFPASARVEDFSTRTQQQKNRTNWQRTYAHAAQGHENQYHANDTPARRKLRHPSRDGNFIPPPANQIRQSVSAIITDDASSIQEPLPQRTRRTSSRQNRKNFVQTATAEIEKLTMQFQQYAINDNPTTADLTAIIVIVQKFFTQVMNLLARCTEHIPTSINSRDWN